MKRITQRRCRCCKELFSPDYRNAQTQLYCGKPECRKASKKASQRLWTLKNPGHFKGGEHIERVQQWRRDNPGYSRRRTSDAALQDDCSRIPSADQDLTAHSPLLPQMTVPALQDFCLVQHPVIIGLIAHLTGATLQDDIDRIARRLEQLGHDVIGSNPTSGGYHDPQVPNLPRPHPNSPGTVQLGGPSSGS